MKIRVSKKCLWLVLLSVLCLTLMACGSEKENHDGEAKTPSSASSLEGMNYQDVITKFEKNGFTNITTETIDDLITGWLTKEGEVESVSVDGEADFANGSWYSVDAPVIISYHVFPEKQEDDAEEPSEDEGQEERIDEDMSVSDFTSLNGKDVVEALSEVHALGYSAELLHDYTEMDLTSEIESYDEETQRGFQVVRIGEVDSGSMNVVLYVDSITNMKEKQDKEDRQNSLTEKLDPFYAWYAVEDYGDTQYPYGFKLHYIMGQLAQEPIDENTWFLKATCTVENAYGNKSEMTCEAKVTGTTDNPSVIEFNVY